MRCHSRVITARRRRTSGVTGTSQGAGGMHVVDEHVELSGLLGRVRLGEADRRRLPGDGVGLQADGAKLLGEVVRMLDTGRIDDSGRVFEALAIEGSRRLVQRLMVE